MTPRRQSRLAAAAAAVIIAATTAAGCGAPSTRAVARASTAPDALAAPAGSPTTSTPARLTPADPSAAAVAAARLLFAARPRLDASFNAAWLRNRGLLTAQLAEQLAAAGPAASDAAWQLWRTHDATLSVTARPVADDAPPDTPTVAVRRLQLSVTPRGAHGWTGAPTRLGVVLTLQASVAGHWLVGSIHVDI